LLAFGLIGPALGQRPEDGEAALEKKERASRKMRIDLHKGELIPNVKDKDHLEAIEVTARMSVYPLFWNTAGRPEVGKVNAIVDDFVKKLGDLQAKRPATNPFIHLLCKEVIERANEVIVHPNGRPLAGINAARLLAAITQRRADRTGTPVAEKVWVDETLPRLAEGNGQLLAETCLTLINDPKMTDGHRYYLYRCLASLLALPPQTPPLLKSETVEKILQKATEQVEKKVVFPKATPRQEVEGYKMFRQQAVVVLAAGRRPTVGEKSRPILALARIAAADADLAPAPRLSERIEAAVGLARMGVASAKIGDIDMDYAAGAVVATVVEFGRQANANKDSDSTRRLRPWRVDAARLGEALDELKVAVKTPYVQNAIKECQDKVLGELEKTISSPAAVEKLVDWLANNAPQGKSLFKSDPTSTIKGAAAAAP